jgi:hypothetical protein
MLKSNLRGNGATSRLDGLSGAFESLSENIAVLMHRFTKLVSLGSPEIDRLVANRAIDWRKMVIDQWGT